MGLMTSPNMMTTKISHAILLVAFVFLGCGIPSHGVDESRQSLTDTSTRKVFDITENGANANANDENSAAITKTWDTVCKGEYKGPAKVVVSKDTFVTGPMVFQGPCTSSKDIVVEIQGELKATTDLSNYPAPEWLKFNGVDSLIVTGDGVVNGQREKTYKGKGEDADAGDVGKPPSNLKLIKVKNALIKGIKSLKSKYFHFHVTECTNVTLDTMTITASGNSPNTDGCHISDSDNVKVINSVIGTCYDCVSIGQGNNQIIVNNITCSPSHGLSVGSLGKYKDKKSVTNVFITNSKLTGATNGTRIKTYAWPNTGEANGIVFDNLTMEKVRNPIIVDQHYGEEKKNGGSDLTDKNNPNSGQDSPYKLKDIKFKNIESIATGEPIMTFACSGTNPCEAVELDNIELTVGGGGVAEAGTVASNRPSGCWNAKLTTKGTIKPELQACQ